MTMKKLLSAITAAALLGTTAAYAAAGDPLNVFAARSDTDADTAAETVEKTTAVGVDEDQGEWWAYNTLGDGNIEIFCDPKKMHTIQDITIPAVINGLKVVKIADNAFKGCPFLSDVTISDGIETIGSSAFENCEYLREVNISDSVKTIENNAFGNCAKLTSIDIPQYVSSIGYYVFKGCKDLTEIRVNTYNDKYYSEDGVLFAYNGGNKMLLQFPPAKTVAAPVYGINVPIIAPGAFEGCKNITSVSMISGVESIGANAFRNCINLHNVGLRFTSIDTINEGTFEGCEKLTTIEIPKSVASIGDRAFAGCASLGKDDSGIPGREDPGTIEIPESVTRIGAEAFENCTSLTNITIPRYVNSIGLSAYSDCENSAFSGCENLAEINVADNNTGGYYSTDGVLFKKDGGEKELILYPRGKTEANYSIPNDVTKIGDLAFSQNTHLKKADINYGVTEIGAYAFSGCTELSSMYLDENVAAINEGAFENCPALKTVIILGDITEIENYTFSQCTNLTKVVLPDSVTSIGDHVFEQCRALATITLPINLSTIGEYAFEGCIALKTISLPEKVAGINRYTFRNSGLVSIDLKNIISIRECAFEECYELRSVTFSKDLSDIGMNAFFACWDLESIDLPDGLITIEFGAFSSCTSLTSVKIPGSVDRLEGNAFGGCTSLETLIISEGVESFFESELFSNCPELKVIYLPKSVEIIAEGIFTGDDKISEIYYNGTRAEWAEVDIRKYNGALSNALESITVHCIDDVDPDDKKFTVTIPNKSAANTGNLTVAVTDNEGKPVEITIGEDGIMDLSELEDGEYSFVFSAENCAPRNYSVTVEGGVVSGLEDGIELHLYGDIDGNGEITIEDVRMINKYLLNELTIGEYDKIVLNVNKDELLNTIDAILIHAHLKDLSNLWS